MSERTKIFKRVMSSCTNNVKTGWFIANIIDDIVNEAINNIEIARFDDLGFHDGPIEEVYNIVHEAAQEIQYG